MTSPAAERSPELLVMAKIAVIAVPFFRSLDHLMFAEGTLRSLQSNPTVHTLDTIAVVNSAEEPKDARRWIEGAFSYVEYNDENCVARAWNKGIVRGFERGADYCLVINLDLLFHSAYLDNLIAFATATPDAVMWSGELWREERTLPSATLENRTLQGCHSCAFLVDQRLFSLVGFFDEGFKPAYFEDADMAYRIAIGGLHSCRTTTALFFHYENLTLQTALLERNIPAVRDLRVSTDANEQRYADKWGGPQGGERFTIPFGGAPSSPKS